MSESESAYLTTPIEPADVKTGFSCGKRALDDYFARHAVPNEVAGIGRAYVLRRGPDDDGALPSVLGFYTLSMANAESAQVAKVVEKKLPKYPMPVALIGRLAIDQRAQGRRLGEKLLMDALRRVVHALQRSSRPSGGETKLALWLGASASGARLVQLIAAFGAARAQRLVRVVQRDRSDVDVPSTTPPSPTSLGSEPDTHSGRDLYRSPLLPRRSGAVPPSARTSPTLSESAPR